MSFQFGAGVLAEPRAVSISRTTLSTSPSDISNAAWSKNNSTVTTGRTDPYGGATAEAMFETTATSASHEISQNSIGTFVNGTRYHQEAIVKAIGSGRYLLMRTFAAGFTSGVYAWFDVGNKRAGQVSSYGSDIALEDVELAPMIGGNGYVRCRMVFRGLSGASCDGSWFGSTTAIGSEPSYTGDTAKGFDFHRASVYTVP